MPSERSGVGRFRNAGSCPACGSDDYCRGSEVADYCTDCKTLFMDDADEWSIRSGGESRGN